MGVLVEVLFFCENLKLRLINRQYGVLYIVRITNVISECQWNMCLEKNDFADPVSFVLVYLPKEIMERAICQKIQ